MTGNNLLESLRDWSTSSLYTGDQSEFRTNVQLTLQNPKINFNTFSIYGKQYSLPTPDGYFIYSFSHQITRGHTLSIGGCCNPVWMNCLDYLNQYQTRLFIYDNYGKLIPLSQMYVLSTCDRCFLIINKDALQKCTSNGIESAKSLFLTYWVNPHPENPISGYEYFPIFNKRNNTWKTDTQSALSRFNSINDTGNTFTWCLVNGVIADLTETELSDSDYISIIHETDIFCKFTTTIDDNITGYESDFYKDYREILHMPKKLNSGNLILTHDLIDIIIKDIDTNNGLYQSRYDYRSVRQITHQDYSVDRTDVDSLRDALHATEISTLTIVRNPVNKRYLGGDTNYIEDLYRNDDSTIVSLLRGTSDSSMLFWQASNLEKSPYLSLIFNNLSKNNPSDDGDPPDLEYYLKALGFYNTANVLYRGVELGKWDNSTLVAIVPPVLIGRKLIPYVFCNGRKILDSKIFYKNISHNKISIYIKDTSIKQGDRVSVLLKDFTSSPLTKKLITESDSTYTSNVDNVYVYTKDNDKFSPLNKNSLTYRTDSIQGNNELTFYPSMYQKIVYLIPENFCFKDSISLDDDLKNRKTLCYKLTDLDGNPILYYKTIDIFINGYWGIYGVDYITYVDVDGYTNLAISNKNYLDMNKTGNVVEWYVYSDVNICDDFDYIDNGILRYGNSSFLFERNVSEVYIEGIYSVSPTNYGSYLSAQDTTEGSIGEHILRYPYILMKSLPELYKEIDNQKRTSISKFFNNKYPSKPTQVFLSKQHSVYSPWLQGIIEELINGTISGVNDPDPVSFINQFPSLNGLKDNDPTLKRDGRINTDYIAVAASYALEYPDTEKDVRTIIQRLINLTLIRDMSSLGVTPV